MHTNHDILGCNGNFKDTHVRIITCVGLSIITRMEGRIYKGFMLPR